MENNFWGLGGGIFWDWEKEQLRPDPGRSPGFEMLNYPTPKIDFQLWQQWVWHNVGFVPESDICFTTVK